MFQWVWAALHGPARQRAFLIEIKTLLELNNAGHINFQLPRESRPGVVGSDELVAKNQGLIDRIDKMLGNK